MAIKKRAAKKAIPKVEVKQIILTQEQWQELNDLRSDFGSIMWILDDTFNTEKSLGQVAFEIGKACSKFSDYHSKLDKIVDDTDPDLIEDYSWDEEEENN